MQSAQLNHKLSPNPEANTFNDFIQKIQEITKLYNKKLSRSKMRNAGIPWENTEFRLFDSAFIFIIDWLLDKAGITPCETSDTLQFLALFSGKSIQDDHSILIFFEDKKEDVNHLAAFLTKNYQDFQAELMPLAQLPFMRINYGGYHKLDRDPEFQADNAALPLLYLKKRISHFDNQYIAGDDQKRKIKVLKIKIAAINQHQIFLYLEEYAKRCFSMTNAIAQAKLKQAYPDNKIDFFSPYIFKEIIFCIVEDKNQRRFTIASTIDLLSNDLHEIIYGYLALPNITFKLAPLFNIATNFSEHGTYSYKLSTSEGFNNPTLMAIKNYFNNMLSLSSREQTNGIIIDAAALAHPDFQLDIKEMFEQHPHLLPRFNDITQYKQVIFKLNVCRRIINYENNPAKNPLHDVYISYFRPTKLNSKIVVELTGLIDKFLKNIYEHGMTKKEELSDIIRSIEKISINLNWMSHQNVISCLFSSGPKLFIERLKEDLTMITNLFWKEITPEDAKAAVLPAIDQKLGR